MCRFGFVLFFILNFLLAFQNINFLYSESCCKSDQVFFENAKEEVQQCGCLFYSESDCSSELLNSYCYWDTDHWIQGDCMASRNQTHCENRPHCFWHEDLKDTGSCKAMLCKELTCSDLKIEGCGMRKDCQWVEQYSLCAEDSRCSCASPDQPDKYCSCLNKDQCAAEWSCSWSETHGCSKK